MGFMSSKTVAGIIAVSGIAVLGGGAVYVNSFASEGTAYACEVTDKDRTTNSEGESNYRVYADCGVYTVSDQPLRGIWNSADIFNEIEPGESYDITTVGFRIPVLSSFPSIIEVN